jgi:hypothetical protein
MQRQRQLVREQKTKKRACSGSLTWTEFDPNLSSRTATACDAQIGATLDSVNGYGKPFVSVHTFSVQLAPD